MDKRAKELLEEEGINSDDLVHPLGEIYDRENATSAKLDCSVKKEVISNVEFFDSEKECTHKVLINVAKETEKYLGCE
jgi:hypothetical protein